MSKKILVVDNDPDFVEANTNLLEAKGYSVISEVNGEDGFARAKQDVPDLIILDVMMKYDSEGLDTALQLKNEDKTKDIPVIMVTGIRKAMHLPFTFEPNESWPNVKAIMEKPIKPDELLKNISTLIGS